VGETTIPTELSVEGRSRRARGKTTAHTDTYHGRFVKLVQDERVVEVVEFETMDPGCAAR
jgi:hypothetical protein